MPNGEPVSVCDGEDGAQGAPGPAGPSGTDGAQGESGPQGQPGQAMAKMVRRAPSRALRIWTFKPTTKHLHRPEETKAVLWTGSLP